MSSTRRTCPTRQARRGRSDRPPPRRPCAQQDLGRPVLDGEEAGIGELIEEDEAELGAPLDLNPAGRNSASVSVAPSVPASRPGPSVAATSVGDPRAEYEMAYSYLTQRQYEQAEMGFRRFLQSNPRDRLVPEASYWLGETYLQRSRYREAAEQFLTISTDHPTAAKAPDALLKLGVALNGLGARDRACAVFAELDRKYPQAWPRYPTGFRARTEARPLRLSDQRRPRGGRWSPPRKAAS